MDLSLNSMVVREQKWKAESDDVLNSLTLWVCTEVFQDLSNNITKVMVSYISYKIR